MGEMADRALDQMFDEEDQELEYKLGFMDVPEAFERGIVDETGALFSSSVSWRSADGRRTLISDMNDGHLMNTIRYLIRKAVQNGNNPNSQIVNLMVAEAQKRNLTLASSEWLSRYFQAAIDDTLEEFWKMARTETQAKDIWLVAVLLIEDKDTKMLVKPTHVLAHTEDDARIQALLMLEGDYRSQTDKLIVKVRREF